MWARSGRQVECFGNAYLNVFAKPLCKIAEHGYFGLWARSVGHMDYCGYGIKNTPVKSPCLLYAPALARNLIMGTWAFGPVCEPILVIYSGGIHVHVTPILQLADHGYLGQWARFVTHMDRLWAPKRGQLPNNP